MKELAVIINPYAGMNIKDSNRIERLKSLIKDIGEIYISRTKEQLVEILKNLKREKVKYLCFDGGDGTVQVCLTETIKVWQSEELPKIGLCRSGTMNTIADNLGIKSNTEVFLRNLYNYIKKGKNIPLISKRVLKVGNNYGFIFGNGMAYNFFQAYYDGHKVGAGKAIELAIKIINSGLFKTPFLKKLSTPIQMEVIIDGKKSPFTSYVTLLASTIRSVGIGFTPFYRANLRDDTFHYFLVKSTNEKLLSLLLQFKFGWPIKKEWAQSDVAQKIYINAYDNFFYILDGEIKGPDKSVLISIGPEVKIIKL